jgi:hypothetical protein
VGHDHTLTATIRDLAGEPRHGVPVAFQVEAGPDTGAAGLCSFDPFCTTDIDGAVSFTYAGQGGPGVDRISASYEDPELGVVEAGPVLTFWDEDCNQNEVADTCDLDCEGFSGLCAAYEACGASDDANGDGQGVPDAGGWARLRPRFAPNGPLWLRRRSSP